MNKKFISALLFGAMTIASTSTFVSCKDYDDDINNLQEQIDVNSEAIAKNAANIQSLQNLINSGSVITDVTKTADGVKVT